MSPQHVQLAQMPKNSKLQAHKFLKTTRVSRFKRNNDVLFEESMRNPNFERECIEETCIASEIVEIIDRLKYDSTEYQTKQFLSNDTFLFHGMENSEIAHHHNHTTLDKALQFLKIAQHACTTTNKYLQKDGQGQKLCTFGHTVRCKNLWLSKFCFCKKIKLEKSENLINLFEGKFCEKCSPACLIRGRCSEINEFSRLDQTKGKSSLEVLKLDALDCHCNPARVYNFEMMDLAFNSTLDFLTLQPRILQRLIDKGPDYSIVDTNQAMFQHGNSTFCEEMINICLPDKHACHVENTEKCLPILGPNWTSSLNFMSIDLDLADEYKTYGYTCVCKTGFYGMFCENQVTTASQSTTTSLLWTTTGVPVTVVNDSRTGSTTAPSSSSFSQDFDSYLVCLLLSICYLLARK